MADEYKEYARKAAEKALERSQADTAAFSAVFEGEVVRIGEFKFPYPTLFTLAVLETMSENPLVQLAESPDKIKLETIAVVLSTIELTATDKGKALSGLTKEEREKKVRKRAHEILAQIPLTNIRHFAQAAVIAIGRMFTNPSAKGGPNHYEPFQDAENGGTPSKNTEDEAG